MIAPPDSHEFPASPAIPAGGRLFAWALAVVGLLVPLFVLRAFRPVLFGRVGGAWVQWTFVCGAAALHGLILTVAFAGNTAFSLFPQQFGPPSASSPPASSALPAGASKENDPAAPKQAVAPSPPLTWQRVVIALFSGILGVVVIQLVPCLILDWVFWKSFQELPPDFEPFRSALQRRIGLVRAIYSLIGTMVTLVLSLLPLSALLVALPAVSPNEAVLADTVSPATTRWQRFRRRLGGVGAGLVVVVALFAFAIELVGRLPLPPKGQFGVLSQKVLGLIPAEAMLTPKGPALFPAGPEPTVGITAGVVAPTPKEMVEKKGKLERALAAGLDDPVRLREARTDLDLVNRQIEEVAPNSPQLRILLDPGWGPWLGQPIWKLLPPPLVQHWPFVFLIVYATDLGLLLLIGRVPLAYNYRNLVVRWRIAGLTALAFTVVVGLLVALLAFVNGMYKLNEGTGIPGNVFVLSDGATDELFSNLGYGDIDNALRQVVTLDQEGNPLPAPVRVARGVKGPDGKLVRLAAGQEPPAGQQAAYLASKEIYFVVSQPVPVKEGEQPRRRLLNMRAVDDAAAAAAVHNIEIYPGGSWFSSVGVRQVTTAEKNPDGTARTRTYVECVLGEGAAGTLGVDAGKPRLAVGDTFQLGDLDWIVVGVMKAEGTTFGSEVWVQNIDVVTKTFGKKGTFTTMVVRADPDTPEAAKALAYHLQNRYTAAKFKAFPEPEYYAELTKTNDQFLTWIVIVAAIMAVGGVFGVMNTMFASIAARIREVGVLRILGFKRWQILISFMLESLAIAAAGGLLGCALGAVADGFEARSQLSGGAGGGKSVSLKMVVDYQTVAAGMLFTLVMGRLGGLVPALSAMRMEILDSLR